MDVSPAIQKLIEQGGVIAGVVIAGVLVFLVLRQLSQDRKADREALAPALKQISDMFGSGQQSLQAIGKMNELTMTRLQRTLDREEADNAALKNELLTTGRRVATLEAKNEEQARNLESSMNLVASLQLKINEYERRIKELETSDQEKLKIIDALKQRIDDLEAQAIQDKRLIQSQQDQIVKLRDQLRLVEDDRAKVLSERELLTKEVEELKQRLNLLIGDGKPPAHEAEIERGE